VETVGGEVPDQHQPVALSPHIPSRRTQTRHAIAPSVPGTMSSDQRHQLGRLGERLAAEHLERLGYRVLSRNHRTRFGELDLVAADDSTIVFCEVKTRRAGSGAPWDALGERKRGQVRRMAAAWLNDVRDRPHASALRFDAVGVTLDARGELVCLEHLEGAF
jgi:putative endonuclease